MILRRALDLVNGVIIRLSCIALVAASAILSYSVVIRYFLKLPTYWEDEAAIFLLVGATFLSAAHVQDRRGHIGIEAIVGLLPKHIDRIRRLSVDLLTFGFCTFFAWKSWTLFHEAWVDGQVTNSTWGPPLWIPYLAMSVGMSLLVLQIILQIVEAVRK